MKSREHKYPVKGIEIIVPKFAPLYTTAAKRDLSVGGTHRASIACIDGNVTPSPSPSNILTSTNAGRLLRAANGVRSVKIAVRKTPIP